jgi:hypothetical protein
MLRDINVMKVLLQDMSERKFCCLTIAVAIVISICGFMPLADAEFWEIDDHEIIFFSHAVAESNLSTWEAVYDVLMSTEVGDYPDGSRFRPIYYFSRVVKSVLFNNNPTVWFAFQFVIYGMSLVLFGLAVRNFLSPLLVVASMTLLASFPFNIDMWSRLGPAENGAFFFTMLLCFALSNIKTKSWAWPVACVSVALAIGYKENFILLFLPLVASFFYMKYGLKKKASLFWLLFPCISGCLAFVVLMKVFFGLSDHVYSEKKSFPEFILTIIGYFASYHFFTIILCIFFILYGKYFLSNKYKKNFSINSVYYFFIFFIIVVLSFGNYVFYQGEIKIGSRYAFPYLFFLLIIFLLTIKFYISIFKDNKWMNVCVYLIFALCFISFGFAQVIIFKHSVRHASRTSNFNEILKIGRNYEEITLLNTSQSITMYEPYFSFKRFSEASLTAGRILYFPLFYPVANSDLNKKLEEVLRTETKLFTGFKDERTTLVVALVNGRWKVIDYNSASRSVDEIPREMSFEKHGSQSFVQEHFFFLAVSPKISYFLVEGDNVLSAAYYVNGIKLEQRAVQFVKDKICLSISKQMQDKALLGLYVIAFKYPVNIDNKPRVSRISIPNK